eukprot:1253065-Amphidinium_carterae.1
MHVVVKRTAKSCKQWLLFGWLLGNALLSKNVTISEHYNTSIYGRTSCRVPYPSKLYENVAGCTRVMERKKFREAPFLQTLLRCKCCGYRREVKLQTQLIAGTLHQESKLPT